MKTADPMPRTKKPAIRTKIPSPKAFIATNIEEQIHILEPQVGVDNDDATSQMVPGEAPPRPDTTPSYADTLTELLQQERSRNEDLRKKLTEVQKLAGEWRSNVLIWEGACRECEVELTRERVNHGQTKGALKLAQDALEQERMKAAKEAEEHLSEKQKLKKQHEAEKNKVTAELSRMIQEERKKHKEEVGEWENTKRFWESLKDKYQLVMSSVQSDWQQEKERRAEVEAEVHRLKEALTKEKKARSREKKVPSEDAISVRRSENLVHDGDTKYQRTIPRRNPLADLKSVPKGQIPTQQPYDF